ncbi:MAG: precorrin-3B synthase [Ilumatobacteraceae bacterium]|nr:precorrin-3B synthase [Ilumatobacteraceae bacterium]
MPAAVELRSRRTGLCPTFDAPSAQRDGLLFRVPLVGARLSIDQLLVLAAVAERHGNGVVELTNRGNVQLRGVAMDGAAEVADALAAAGLGDDLARVVTIAPFATSDAWALRDAVCAALGTLDLTGLSGKFVVHIAGADGPVGGGSLADVALKIGAGSSVVVDLGGERYAADAGVAVSAVTATALTCIAAGPDARRKDVVVRLALPRLPSDAAVDVAPAPVGVVRHGADTSIVGGIVLGRTDPAQLRTIAALCTRHGVTEVGVTPWRSLVLPAAGNPDAMLAELAALGLIVDASHPASGVVACIGRAGCWQTELDTLAEADAVIAGRRDLGRAATVHVSGCAKSCASHSPVDVTLMGRDDSSGFDVVRGARP